MTNSPNRLSAHQVQRKTLRLIFSASEQNIKNLVGIFGAICVGIMHAKFKPSSFNDDRWKDVQGTSRHIANFPLCFAREG